MNLIYDEGGVYIRNLANTADKHGIGQYCFARNFELAGSGYVISDGSAEYKCVFINRETMTLNDAEHYYECLKLVNSTYFVRFGTDVLVLDLEQQMATLILNGKNSVRRSLFFGVSAGREAAHRCRQRYGGHLGKLGAWLRPLC